MTRRSVCVFCASGMDIDVKYLRLAAEVGEELGRRGLGLVSGAGSISSMGSLARAARRCEVYTVGVIPQALTEYEVVDEDADELIVTTTMRERKAVMDERSDAFLVLPGGLGTLEEFVEAWVGRVLGMHHKPVVVLDPWDDFEHLHRLVRSMVDGRFLSLDSAAAVAWTQGVSEAFDRIEAMWSEPPPDHAPGLAEVLVELEAD